MFGLIRTLGAMMGLGKPAEPRPRSGAWPHLERLAFERDGFACRACGRKDKLRGHHIIPFHVLPSLELELTNVITLCQPLGGGCHLKFGHTNPKTGERSWRVWNPNVVSDCKRQQK